ncbi:MAG: hypothetical protein K2Q97_06670, partial [Burkholderiaceae bacterium]|nr:hypothetical protein [Burkholderiaceae bacterium]
MATRCIYKTIGLCVEVQKVLHWRVSKIACTTMIQRPLITPKINKLTLLKNTFLRKQDEFWGLRGFFTLDRGTNNRQVTRSQTLVAHSKTCCSLFLKTHAPLIDAFAHARPFAFGPAAHGLRAPAHGLMRP